MSQTAALPPLVDVKAVAWMLSISVRQVWNMHQTGALGPLPVKLGTRTLWRKDEIEAWISAGCPRRDRWIYMVKRR